MKRLVSSNGKMFTLPLIIIFGSKPNGPQRTLLEVFKALGIGSGRGMYQPDCKKPDYHMLSRRFPILAGYTVDRDWKQLSEYDAKFILVMQDESIQDDEDHQYYHTLQQHFGSKLLSVHLTDAGITQTIIDFLSVPGYVNEIKPQVIQEVGKLTLIERIKNFIYARAKWIQAGKPVRTLDAVRQLYDTKCSPCYAFDNDMCGICGCRIKRNTLMMNKLAWATESCPLAEPQWEAEIKVDISEIDSEKVDAEVKEEVEKQVSDTPAKSGKCCGG